MKTLAKPILSLVLILSLTISLTTRADDTLVPYANSADVPDNVLGLWEEVDPAAEPLDTEIVKEWTEAGIVYRYVIFTVGTFKGEISRIASFYTFPEGAENIPAVVWAHGGGQRAELERGKYFAQQGYAMVDINWNGREILEDVEQNTDWGAIDPTQGPKFYPQAKRKATKLDFVPDEFTIDPVLSPRNGNWFMLAYAGRRAITFLEQQPEVDKDHIGFTGFSMGGNITSFAAIDSRLKAVVPMVGGAGYVTTDSPALPGSGRRFRKPDHSDLHAATMQSQAYYQHTTCPVLLLSASDDFHSRFEFIYRSMNCLPHRHWRVSQNMHLSHNLDPKQWVLLNLWFDKYLKGEEITIAQTAKSSLTAAKGSTSAKFTVIPDRQEELTQIDIYYSHDPNPKSRFWIHRDSSKANGTWAASLPMPKNLPLFVFANCTYRLNSPIDSFRGIANAYSITSDEQVHLPDTIDLEQLHSDAKPETVFSNLEIDGFRDWGFMRNGSLSTYKFRDPRARTPDADAQLHVVVDAPRKNMSFRFRATKNKYVTGVKAPKTTYVAATTTRQMGEQEVVLSIDDFADRDKNSMTDWTNIATFALDVVEHRKSLNLRAPENRSIIKRLEWINP